MRTFVPEVEDAIVQNQQTFVWETLPYERQERGKRWYLFMTLVAVLFVAFAVWTANFLFAFIILLSGIILILAGNESPAPILVQVGDTGIVINGKLRLFRDIEEFAIVYNPPISKVLYLEPKGIALSRTRLALEDQDPVELRDHLKKYLKENLDLQSEHFSDILGRLLKI